MGAELTAPDPVALMRERGVAPATARIVADRIAALGPDERRRCAGVRWAGIANACAVPAPERPELRAIGELARTAAAAGADDTGLHVRTVLHPVRRAHWMAMSTHSRWAKDRIGRSGLLIVRWRSGTARRGSSRGVVPQEPASADGLKRLRHHDRASEYMPSSPMGQ